MWEPRIRPQSVFPLLLLLLLPPLPCRADGCPASEASSQFGAALARARLATEELRDATYRLRQEEWKGGRALPVQEMEVKYRAPGDLYLRWVGESFRGREVLYRPDRNRGRLRVSIAAWLPSLDLSPTGSLALSDSRHPVWMAGMPHIVQLVATELSRRPADPALCWTYEDLGVLDAGGAPARCFDVRLPKDRDPGLYATRVRVCFDEKTGLISRFASWNVEDGELRRVEDNEFSRLTPNPGLSEQDFDPENPAYGF